MDYDVDGCYPTPAVGPGGTVNPGLRNSGALNGQCHDANDLDNGNMYVRSRCDADGLCGFMYALYFEKDQVSPGWDPFGHRHDWEHVVVWVKDNQAQHVSVSAHGEWLTRSAADVVWEGRHPKVVYHKDGGLTHAFRFAGATRLPRTTTAPGTTPPCSLGRHGPLGPRPAHRDQLGVCRPRTARRPLRSRSERQQALTAVMALRQRALA